MRRVHMCAIVYFRRLRIAIATPATAAMASNSRTPGSGSWAAAAKTEPDASDNNTIPNIDRAFIGAPSVVAFSGSPDRLFPTIANRNRDADHGADCEQFKHARLGERRNNAAC